MKFGRKRRILKRFLKKHGLNLEKKMLIDEDWNLKRSQIIKKIRKNILICEKILKIITIANKTPELLIKLQEKREKIAIFKQEIENLQKSSPKRLFHMYFHNFQNKIISSRRQWDAYIIDFPNTFNEESVQNYVPQMIFQKNLKFSDAWNNFLA